MKKRFTVLSYFIFVLLINIIENNLKPLVYMVDIHRFLANFVLVVVMVVFLLFFTVIMLR